MAVSGQITVITPGAAIQGPASPTGSSFILKAHPNNTGLILVSSDVNSGSLGGFPLAAGDYTIRRCYNLSGLYFNTTVANSVLTWFLMES